MSAYRCRNYSVSAPVRALPIACPFAWSNNSSHPWLWPPNRRFSARTTTASSCNPFTTADQATPGLDPHSGCCRTSSRPREHRQGCTTAGVVGGSWAIGRRDCLPTAFLTSAPPLPVLSSPRVRKEKVEGGQS